jgi:hypothetical protein
MKNQKVAEHEAVNVVTGREAKKIGIEIEFFGVNYRQVIAELRAAGLAVADWAGYTHAVVPQWKITSDVSVTGTNTGLGKGLELVSPPLTMEQMDVQLKTAMEVLNRLGAKVDRTCGVHVHHEIDDLKVQDIKNIYKIYNKHQNHINSLMPASRRQAHNDNGYCRAISPSEMAEIEEATTIQQIGWAQTSRYRVINFQSYVKYGTVEFRQHSGSTDYTKLINWVRITQSLVAAATRVKEVKPLTEAQKNRETQAFSREVGLVYTLQGIYSRDRKAEIKKAEKARAARTA